MLVLTLKPGESLKINSNIEVVIVSTKGKRVKLGVIAPKEIGVVRSGAGKKESAPQRYAVVGNGRDVDLLQMAAIAPTL